MYTRWHSRVRRRHALLWRSLFAFRLAFLERMMPWILVAAQMSFRSRMAFARRARSRSTKFSVQATGREMKAAPAGVRANVCIVRSVTASAYPMRQRRARCSTVLSASSSSSLAGTSAFCRRSTMEGSPAHEVLIRSARALARESGAAAGPRWGRMVARMFASLSVARVAGWPGKSRTSEARLERRSIAG